MMKPALRNHQLTQETPKPHSSSPLSSGPAGPRFEVQVGAHYALGLICESEPLGLPGAVAKRIAFQRASMGHPLDDVIVHAETPGGDEIVLDIQVKRAIGFTASEAAFKAVMAQIAETILAPGFWGSRRVLAVAVERTSTKIDGVYQEVLQLARLSSTSTSFFEQINEPGRFNADMRTFVENVRSALKQAGAELDDNRLFELLRRFQILYFDYNRAGSVAAQLDIDRAHRLLSNSSVVSGHGLRDNVIAITLDLASQGGDVTSATMRKLLAEKGHALGPAPGFAKARAHLMSAGNAALADIDDTIAGFRLLRGQLVDQVDALFDTAEFVEIVGDGGVGKSAVLKAMAQRCMQRCPVVVLKPDRTPPRGWEGLRSTLGIDGTAEAFLADLACDGGGILFIDGLDRFSDRGEQATVCDMLRAAAHTRGIKTVITARSGWDHVDRCWLPDGLLNSLKRAPAIELKQLSDTEADQIAARFSDLAVVLSASHPASPIARNLFKLRRLLRMGERKESILSEAALAVDWWRSGDTMGDDTASQRSRRRILQSVADATIARTVPVETSAENDAALDALIASGSLAEVSAESVVFAHDVLSDWGVGCRIAEQLTLLDGLSLAVPAPAAMIRGIEIASRILCEDPARAADWDVLLAYVDKPEVHLSWRRPVLLALVRSEASHDALVRKTGRLLADDGRLAIDLVHLAVSLDSRAMSEVLAAAGVDVSKAPKDWMAPAGSAWFNLGVWLFKQFDELPGPMLPATIAFFEDYMKGALGRDPLTPYLLHRVLSFVEAAHGVESRPMLPRPSPSAKWGIGYGASRKLLHQATLLIAMFANSAPTVAKKYLELVAADSRVEQHAHELLEFPGTLPAAAPLEFAALIRAAMAEEVSRVTRSRHGRDRTMRPFGYLDSSILEGVPGAGPFLGILNANPDAGLSLVRDMLHHVIRWWGDSDDETATDQGAFDLVMADGSSHRVSTPGSYQWSRGRGPSQMLCSALMAVETWAHSRIEAGESVDKVISKVLGDGPTPACLVLVAVDLALSHSWLTVESLPSLMGSPETLALDASRFNHDRVEQMTKQGMWSPASWGRDAPMGEDARREQLAFLTKRASRQCSLHLAMTQFVFAASNSQIEAVRGRLDSAVQRMGAWNRAEVRWFDPAFMASHGLLRLDRRNCQKEPVTLADGSAGYSIDLIMPKDQANWLAAEEQKHLHEHKSFETGLSLRMAVDGTKKIEAQHVAAALDVLQTKSPPFEPAKDRSTANDPELAWLAAAIIVAGHGAAEDYKRHATSIATRCLAIARGDHTTEHTHSGRVMYDRQALAICGLIRLAVRGGTEATILDVLLAIGQHGASGISACFANEEAIIAFDTRLVRSVCRVGLEASIFVPSPNSDAERASFAARKSERLATLRARAESEDEWLRRGGAEPTWPVLPGARRRARKRGFRIGGGEDPSRPAPQPRAKLAFDHEQAARWVDLLAAAIASAPDIVDAFIDDHRDWFAAANQADEDSDDADYGRAFSSSYFQLAAIRAPSWTSDEFAKRIVSLLAGFSDYALFATVSSFLLACDRHHFNCGADRHEWLALCRDSLASVIRGTRGWRREHSRTSDGMEMNITSAFGALCFHVDRLGGQVCYLGDASPESLTPFVETLAGLALDAPGSLYVATRVMTVLDRALPQVAAPMVLNMAERWCETRGADSGFWSKGEVGKQTCKVLATPQSLSPETTARLSKIAETLLAAGVPDARILEQATREDAERWVTSAGERQPAPGNMVQGQHPTSPYFRDPKR